MKSKELFGEKGTFVIKRLKEEKKVRFKSTINLPSHDDISDGGAELYFDAIDQNVIMDQTPAPSVVTNIKTSSSSHIGNRKV